MLGLAMFPPSLLLLPFVTATVAGAYANGFAKPWGASAPCKDNTFDYVVVGAGTAGLTLAARLAEGSSYSVAVIEAGGYYEEDNGNVSVVPGYATQFSGTDPTNIQPLVDWGFVTVPQKVSHVQLWIFVNLSWPDDTVGRELMADVCITPGVKPLVELRRGTGFITNGELPSTMLLTIAHLLLTQRRIT